MPDSDDLVPLLLQARKDLNLHQGKVLAWDVGTGRNTISVSGAALEDLTMLNVADAPNVREGDIVGVLRYKSTYFILGRIVTPGSESFATAAVEFRHAKGFAQGFGLNTTFTTIVSASLQAPAWANQAAFTVWANTSLLNTSSGFRTVEIFAGGGNAGDLQFSASSVADIDTNRELSITAITQDIIADPGDMQFTALAATGAGSLPADSVNSVSVDALAIFTRTR